MAVKLEILLNLGGANGFYLKAKVLDANAYSGMSVVAYQEEKKHKTRTDSQGVFFFKFRKCQPVEIQVASQKFRIEPNTKIQEADRLLLVDYDGLHGAGSEKSLVDLVNQKKQKYPNSEVFYLSDKPWEELGAYQENAEQLGLPKGTWMMNSVAARPKLLLLFSKGSVQNCKAKQAKRLIWGAPDVKKELLCGAGFLKYFYRLAQHVSMKRISLLGPETYQGKTKKLGHRLERKNSVRIRYFPCLEEALEHEVSKVKLKVKTKTKTKLERKGDYFEAGQ